MISKKIALVPLLFLGLQSCQEKLQKTAISTPEKVDIQSIEWSNYGGMTGYHESLLVTKDSVIHTYLTTTNNEKTQNKYANSVEDWEDLTNALEVEDFRKVKNGGSNLAFDGTDKKIVIKSKTTADSLINGSKDKANFGKIAKFTQILNRIGKEKK